MAANFEVTVSAMNSAASNISNYNEQFKEQVQQAYQTTQTLKSSWEGPASEEFAENVDLLKKWWDELATVMETYSAELKKAAEEYQDADKTSAGFFKG